VTLSPVFRSPEAVQVLREEGVWRGLDPAARAQAAAIATVRRDLPNVLDATYIDAQAGSEPVAEAGVELEFVQEFFFLIIFRGVLESVGVSPAGLELCSELNFCIKGTITAADNLFDDQDKTLLPLRAGEGARFRSILQLLAFERLAARALLRGERSGAISSFSGELFQRELLSRMAAIGSLEGSEEAGVATVLEPERMVDLVHRVRGGALFELAFVAPRQLESSVEPALLDRAQSAISRLGTAFQIVDDLTDFEWDLAHGRHNLLVAQITHRGSQAEQSDLRSLKQGGTDDSDVVTRFFADSAGAVIERGEEEAQASLEELQELGFWFSPGLANQLLRAIVGLEGVARMRAL
jgi:hypothetical protein